MFNSWFGGHVEDFKSYCSHMSRDGSLSAEVTLAAAAHLLLRPIRIVSDNQDDANDMGVSENEGYLTLGSL